MTKSSIIDHTVCVDMFVPFHLRAFWLEHGYVRCGCDVIVEFDETLRCVFLIVFLKRVRQDD